MALEAPKMVEIAIRVFNMKKIGRVSPRMLLRPGLGPVCRQRLWLQIRECSECRKCRKMQEENAGTVKDKWRFNSGKVY